MNRVRVAHLIDPFLPVTQNWIYSQLAFNAACDSAVFCQTRINGEQFPFQPVFPVFARPGWVASFSSFLARARAAYFVSPYTRFIAEFKPDLLHAHFAWEAWRNRALIEKTSLPLATTFYGLDVNKLPRKRAWRERYRWLFERGDLFLCEGPYMASRLIDLGCPVEKVKVAFLGIDIERIQRIRGTAGGPERESPLVLAVGLDREKKGAIYALRAFARIAFTHSDAAMHFVGDGPYRTVLQKMAHAQGIGDRVVFHGYLPVADYLLLLARTSVLVAPSICAENGDTEGGAPVCTIEAQAMGVPVVGFRHCDMPSVVIDGTTGLLCAEKDVETLASSLDLLIRDDQLRMRMGLAGMQHARKQHDIRNQVVTITDLYRRVFEKRPQR